MTVPDDFDYPEPVEDEHSADHPFCWNPACNCHEDEVAIFQLSLYVQDGLMTPAEATDFVKGKGI